MRILLPIIATLIAIAPAAGQARRTTPPPPAGAKVVSGRHFDVFVSKTEEKSMGVEGFTLKIYQVVAVAKTLTHGTQRISRRVEAINVDLLDAANWEIADFDGDGFDDYRFVAQINKNGCHTWQAERWEPDHDRFMSAPKFAHWTDAQKKVLAKSCN
jgi:hypothetical protein